MRKGQVLEYFGTQAEAARKLGITRASVNNWGEIVPEGMAYKLQVITRGKLRVDTSKYSPRKHKKRKRD